MIDYARPATLDDVEYVAEHMREEDIEEAGAFGLPPLEALTIGFNNSNICQTLLTPDGTPCAIAGISPSTIHPTWGAIWMLGTHHIEEVPITFIRHSRKAIKALFEATEYDAFFNYTYARNTVHHKWLKWCGFTFLRKVELPPFDQEFFEFVSLRG